jgi:hypothetical protein
MRSPEKERPLAASSAALAARASAMKFSKSRTRLSSAAFLSAPVWKPNLQPDFNVRVIERFGPDSFAVLRELDESDRFVQK